MIFSTFPCHQSDYIPLFPWYVSCPFPHINTMSPSLKFLFLLIASSRFSNISKLFLPVIPFTISSIISIGSSNLQLSDVIIMVRQSCQILPSPGLFVPVLVSSASEYCCHSTVSVSAVTISLADSIAFFNWIDVWIIYYCNRSVLKFNLLNLPATSLKFLKESFIMSVSML